MVTPIVVDDRDVEQILICPTCREGFFKEYPSLRAAFDSQDPNFKNKAREKVKEFFEGLEARGEAIREAMEERFNSLPETVRSEERARFIEIMKKAFLIS